MNHKITWDAGWVQCKMGQRLAAGLDAVRDLGVYIGADVTMRAHVRNCNRPRLLCSTPTDPQRVSLTVSWRPAHLASCTGGQQRWLQLLLSGSWNFRHTVTVATVCHECRRTPVSRQGGRNTQPHFSVSCTGCKYRRGSSSGCVFWCTGRCLNHHHHQYFITGRSP